MSGTQPHIPPQSSRLRSIFIKTKQFNSQITCEPQSKRNTRTKKKRNKKKNRDL